MQLAFWTILEAIDTRSIYMLSAPPNPWKYDELSDWLDSSLILGPSLQDHNSNKLAILEAAEKALDEFLRPLSTSKDTTAPCDCMETVKASLERPQTRRLAFDSQRRDLLPEKELESVIEQQVFADLRQMMFIPALHTEYRRFVVLREKDQIVEKIGDYKAPKDSVRCFFFSS